MAKKKATPTEADEIKKAAKRYADGWPGVINQHWANSDCFEAGARWMRRRMKRKARGN